MLDIKNWSIEWGGRTLSVETGRFALQANASCTVRYGDTVMMATVVESKEPRENIDYFPLMVDFEEKLYAAGKIKGSRFIKREGRPTEEAILSGRVIDRAIRPLFDERVRNDVQVVITSLCIDGENDAAITGLIAASCAIHMSSIPWDGPIGAARIGRINGELVLNVTADKVDTESDLDLVVSGTPEKLVMVEAGASEVKEDDMFKAIKWGCEQLQPVIDLIEKVRKEAGKEKMALPEFADDLENVDDTEEEKVRKATKKFVAGVADSMIFNSLKVGRKERNGMIDEIKEALKAHLTEKGFAEEAFGAGIKNLKEYIAAEITRRILEKDQRLDGRKLTDIRELQTSIDLLPRTHGSAMFMRGDTQVLSVVTLGSPGDVQTLDTMEEDGTKRYMHHYNDAPFAYGEAGMMRGPGRRAIGHGALAERALIPVLPEAEQFPYTIRVVSEVLGSNGSSSMASTCGSSMSLMAAGVPLKKAVAGIAMGLASNEAGDWKVLTDLQDIEDGKGGMDFKIAGTREGITAIQMDTKTKGLNWGIVEQTIKQAYEARLEVLKAMEKSIVEPKEELSQYAPHIETIVIDPDKIRDVIGPGGKVINKIIDETGVQIDIEQDGRVMITSVSGDAMAKAKKMVEDLTKEVQVGEEYEGEVVRLMDFGAFVQILPGKDGMVHVSEISWNRVEKPSDVLKIGDKVKVVVKEIDDMGRINLSMKALLPKPEGWTPPPPRTGGFDRGRKPGGFKKPFGRRRDR